MFRHHRFSCALVVVLAAALSVTQTDGESTFFTNLFHKASESHQQVKHQSSADRRSFSTGSIPESSPASSIVATSSTTSKYSSRLLNDTQAKATTSSKSQGRSQGWGWDDGGHGHGGGGGGWGGWGHVQTHYVHAPSQGGGFGTNGIIAALAGLGLLAALAYALFNRQGSQIILVNSSGRRRRAVEDFGDGLEGESLPEMMSRVFGSIESAWMGPSNGKKLDLFQLPDDQQ